MGSHPDYRKDLYEQLLELSAALYWMGNIRYFSDNELEALRIIECLKKSGLEIKDIKQFFSGYLKAAPAMKKGKNYLKPENQLLKLKSRNSKKLFPS